MAIAGPVIRLFDRAANRLLRRVGIEPIEELPSGATPEDLEQIIAESRQEAHLDRRCRSCWTGAWISGP